LLKLLIIIIIWRRSPWENSYLTNTDQFTDI